MKRILVLGIAVAALVGSGFAYSATSGGGAPAGPAVWGGGHVAFTIEGTSFARDFSVLARQPGGRIVFAASGVHFEGDVTCVRVFGKTAAVAGFVTAPAHYAGMVFEWFATDNGTLGDGGAPDQVTPVLILSDEDLAAEGVPPAYPHVCLTWLPEFGEYMADLTAGDVVVQQGAGS